MNDVQAVMFRGVPYVAVPNTAEKLVVIRGDQTLTLTLPATKSEADPARKLADTLIKIADHSDTPSKWIGLPPHQSDAPQGCDDDCLKHDDAYFYENGSHTCPCHKKAPQGDKDCECGQFDRSVPPNPYQCPVHDTQGDSVEGV